MSDMWMVDWPRLLGGAGLGPVRCTTGSSEMHAAACGKIPPLHEGSFLSDLVRLHFVISLTAPTHQAHSAPLSPSLSCVSQLTGVAPRQLAIKPKLLFLRRS